jgi:hypothetical protein
VQDDNGGATARSAGQNERSGEGNCSGLNSYVFAAICEVRTNVDGVARESAQADQENCAGCDQRVAHAARGAHDTDTHSMKMPPDQGNSRVRSCKQLVRIKTDTLWVCQNHTDGRNEALVVGTTALRSFDLKSGAARGTHPFPPNSGICNDIAIAADGSAYVSESFGGRIHRLKPGASQLEVWASDQQLAVIDGLSFLADGSLYANNFATGKLFRIPVNADGSAGAVQPIETSIPLVRPDGLRTAWALTQTPRSLSVKLPTTTRSITRNGQNTG